MNFRETMNSNEIGLRKEASLLFRIRRGASTPKDLPRIRIDSDEIRRNLLQKSRADLHQSLHYEEESKEKCPACRVQIENREADRDLFLLMGFGKCILCKKNTYQSIRKKIIEIKLEECQHEYE